MLYNLYLVTSYSMVSHTKQGPKGRHSSTKVALSMSDPVPRFTYTSNRAEWKLEILPLGIQPTVAEGILLPRPCCIQLGTKALYLQHMASRGAA